MFLLSLTRSINEHKRKVQLLHTHRRSSQAGILHKRPKFQWKNLTEGVKRKGWGIGEHLEIRLLTGWRGREEIENLNSAT